MVKKITMERGYVNNGILVGRVLTVNRWSSVTIVNLAVDSGDGRTQWAPKVLFFGNIPSVITGTPVKVTYRIQSQENYHGSEKKRPYQSLVGKSISLLSEEEFSTEKDNNLFTIAGNVSNRNYPQSGNANRLKLTVHVNEGKKKEKTYRALPHLTMYTGKPEYWHEQLKTNQFFIFVCHVQTYSRISPETGTEVNTEQVVVDAVYEEILKEGKPEPVLLWSTKEEHT